MFNDISSCSGLRNDQIIVPFTLNLSIYQSELAQINKRALDSAVQECIFHTYVSCSLSSNVKVNST